MFLEVCYDGIFFIGVAVCTEDRLSHDGLSERTLEWIIICRHGRRW